MSKQANPYSLRIEKNILEKSRFIAKLNGRSLNKEIEFVLKQNIADFEKKNGPISITQNNSK